MKLNTKTPVTKNLLLLDIKPESFSEQFAECRDAYGLLYIKGCRRDVLLGSSDVINFGQTQNVEGVRVYEGAQAYEHLLTYVTGLISRTRGESQIVSQFKGAYKELGDRSPSSALSLHRLYMNIVRDNGVIRNYVTPDLKPAFYEACAQELSDQQDRHAVLVVVNTDKSGKKPDAMTENIMRYIANGRKSAAKKIIFTHPDQEKLQNVYSHFLKQKSKGKISSSIGTLPFEAAFDANNALQSVGTVYVCFPMGRNLTADQKMVAEWRQKEVLGGRLIHLGGNPKADRQSSGQWLNPELFHFTPPESILEWQGIRQTRNAKLIEAGKSACRKFAKIRSEGGRPSISAL